MSEQYLETIKKGKGEVRVESDDRFHAEGTDLLELSVQ